MVVPRLVEAFVVGAGYGLRRLGAGHKPGSCHLTLRGWRNFSFSSGLSFQSSDCCQSVRARISLTAELAAWSDMPHA